LFSFLDLADDADKTLFNSMLKKTTMFSQKSRRALSIYDRKATCLICLDAPYKFTKDHFATVFVEIH